MTKLEDATIPQFKVGDMVVLDDPSYFRKELQGQIGKVIGFTQDYSGAPTVKIMMTDKNLTPAFVAKGYSHDTLADHWEPHADRLRLATPLEQLL